MRMRVLLLVGTLVVLAGCGGVASVPEFSASRECERSGGYWHPALNVCEITK